MASKWAEEYTKLYPNIKIDISAGGAGKGITDVLSGMVDIAMVSDEYTFLGESTVIDMTTDDFKIIRVGAGYDELKQIIDISEE